tara:strand:+ start:3044 stop:3253 length:210 start_codon:yes stop_codon:yes gene_type:complete
VVNSRIDIFFCAIVRNLVAYNDAVEVDGMDGVNEVDEVDEAVVDEAVDDVVVDVVDDSEVAFQCLTCSE